MTKFHDIDLYCERVAPGFWEEPLNALSNVAFVIAALVVWRLARRLGQTDWITSGLILLGGLIGVGSFLFHTHADSGSELADVVPIWSFVGLYIIVIIYRATLGNWIKTGRIVAITSVFVALGFWLTGDAITTDGTVPPKVLNGSLQYLPAVIALCVFALITQLRKHPARYLVSAAAVTFVASVVFRTVDLAICNLVPIGSHFVWHLLNGTMVGLLLTVLVVHFPALGTKG